ncbi:MAG: rubrerythrin [Clostridiales bacterium]|nr:rubrerythrin [Clostridiales bacterium]
MEFALMPAASELSYPEIKVENNLKDARLLLPSYGGDHSELTAILTYAFQSYITYEEKDFSKQLEMIAVVEMRHHELLGKAIYKLGGYPIMGARNYWNGSYVNYTLDPIKFLKQNIAAEEQAILNYEKTILSVDSTDIKLLLERIILDEELHIKIFKAMITAIEGSCAK